MQNVSFKIQEKKLTAIVGKSGAGKTTIASLIARFWDVQKGRISIGGIDIRDMSPQTVCRVIKDAVSWRQEPIRS